MKSSSKILGLIVLLLLVPGSVFGDRAHDLAQQAAAQKAVRCPPGSLTVQECHQQFPDGCTNSNKITYDPYLDFLKNQVPGPTLASTADLGEADFKTLETKIPTGMGTAHQAKFASKLAALGQGNIVTVIAYLYFVEDTSKGGGGKLSPGETCNCRLQLPDSYDYHIGLGFDPALAAQIRQNKPKPLQSPPTTMEKTSVVAEMTPHTRTPKWTFARVNSLQGQQVKVVGQLMIDNVHLKTSDDCGLSGASANCWRSTVWEVHPVMQFYVCNLTAGCDQSSPDSAWTTLDKVP